MNQFWKLSSILAVLALLVVMGLSTQSTVQAQAPSATVNGKWVCSEAGGMDGCAGNADETTSTAADNTFTITLANVGASPSDQITIHNTSLATTGTRTDQTDADRNPKVITGLSSGTITVQVVRKSTGLTDDSSGSYQVKGFHGNNIRITYASGTGAIGTDTSVIVDDVKPTLVTSSPAVPLIVKGRTSVTFSADITDSLSGYTTVNTPTGSATRINNLTGLVGQLVLTPSGTPFDPTTHNDQTQKGGVRLVVAGNVVTLDHTNFTKIDGGWRVTKDLGSSALQAISTNVPWYFETRDRAGNTQRISGTISGRSGGPDDADSDGTSTPAEMTTTLVDTKFDGSLGATTFARTSVRVSRDDDNGNPVVSNAQPITGFENSRAAFTFTNAYVDDADLSDGTDDPGVGTDVLFNDAKAVQFLSGTTTAVAGTAGYQCPFDDPDTLDTTNNTLTTVGADDDDSAAQLAVCGAPKGASYEILGSNLITVDSEAPTLPDSRANVLTGKAYNPVTKGDRTAKNSIKLVFVDVGVMGGTAAGSGLDANTVTPSAFSVSGNTVVAASLQSGNRVYLTLAENLGSTDRPTVSLAGGVVTDKAGNAAESTTIAKAHDGLGPNLTLSKSADLSNGRLTVTIASDEQLSEAPTVWVTKAADRDGSAKVLPTGKAPTMSTDGSPLTSGIRQVDALSYAFTQTASGANDGEYSVYVRATDTNSNAGTAGDAASSSTAKAFSFELDSRLNGGDPPKVTVGEENTMTEDATTLEAEAVDPMIVTVDFSNEGAARGKEYHRDGYRTVELTSAKLKVTFADGTSETKTFNLTTDVSTPDNVKFTIPILSPRVGTYELTVQAEDSAGNVRTDSAGTTPQDLKATWKVISPRPVNVDLAPGWNLISLPFQPGNPAINSVIPANHPADIVMTFDNASQIWMVSRRDAETGLFVGDIAVLSASTAYFVRTDNFQPLRMLRPPLATAAAAPPPPPAIAVVAGWNLVPVVSNDIPTPDAIAADVYFGTLGAGNEAGWLKALTFDTLVRTWISVTPGSTVNLGDTGINPCTNAVVDKAKVEAGTEPCQIGQYEERSTRTDDVAASDGPDGNPGTADDVAASGGADGYVGQFDGDDTVTIGTPVMVGKGYWLYSTIDGVIIP